MATALEYPMVADRPERASELVPLENGDRLTAGAFLRRYQAMPAVKKAELIEGVVYMGSPVRIKQHAGPDAIVQGWLCCYYARTSGTHSATNATNRLDVDNVPQPDALLRLLPECGGRSRVDEEGYLVGPPELAVEVCADRASIDLRDKLIAYRRAGVREYIVWRTVEHKLDWFVLEGGRHRPNLPDPQGLLRSRVFPGLWLDVAALLVEDAAKVMDVLQAGLQSPEHTAFVAQLEERGKG